MEMPGLGWLERGIAEHDQVEVIVRFCKHGAPKLGIAILRNRNDTLTCLLQDIGAVIQCPEYQVVYGMPSDNQSFRGQATSLD